MAKATFSEKERMEGCAGASALLRLVEERLNSSLYDQDFEWKQRVLTDLKKLQDTFSEYHAEKRRLMEEAVRICAKEGHVGEWSKNTYTKEEPVWDAGFRGYAEVEITEWSRTCTRCGEKECVNKEPDELREARLKKEKEDEIKCLEKRLKKLKSESN